MQRKFISCHSRTRSSEEPIGPDESVAKTDILSCLPYTLHNDQEVAILAFKYNGHTLRSALGSRKDKQVVLQAVQQNG